MDEITHPSPNFNGETVEVWKLATRGLWDKQAWLWLLTKSSILNCSWEISDLSWSRGHYEHAWILSMMDINPNMEFLVICFGWKLLWFALSLCWPVSAPFCCGQWPEPNPPLSIKGGLPCPAGEVGSVQAAPHQQPAIWKMPRMWS